MDPLKADNSKVVPVSPGEHLIEAASTDGMATIRTKAEVDQGQKTAEIQLKSLHDQQLKMPHAETARKPAEANAAPTWTDPDTGLMWTKNDNATGVNWSQAITYCSNLQLAGYSGWRLPTIEELEGIYDHSVSLQGVFDWGDIYHVHVKGNLKLTGWIWSSSQGDDPGLAWNVDFSGSGKRYPSQLVFPANRALCVRRSGERSRAFDPEAAN